MRVQGNALAMSAGKVEDLLLFSAGIRLEKISENSSLKLLNKGISWTVIYSIRSRAIGVS